MRKLRPPEGVPFRGWTRPGPVPPGGVEAEPGETLDFLCGSWRIFQLERGHRFSADDLLVAWWGTRWAPRAERVLDLGSGIGSVALVAAWKLPGAAFVTVEAQEASRRLASKSVSYDGVAERFRILAGDLRDAAGLAGEGAFDLVLGSPPYYPRGSVTEPSSAQAIPARVETRGTVADYAAAASRALAPGGVFAVVFPWADRARALAGLAAAGLLAIHERAVVFREGESPRLALYAASRADHLPEAFARPGSGFPAAEPDLVLRGRDGSTPPAWAAIRLSLGLPPGDLAA